MYDDHEDAETGGDAGGEADGGGETAGEADGADGGDAPADHDLAGDGGRDAPDGPAFPTRCVRAVVALHDRFEAWLSGRAPDDPATFAGIEGSLADAFRIVSPSGDIREVEALLASLRAGHGRQPSGFGIEIRDVAVRDVAPGGDRCLVTYEEWQSGETGGEATGRLSSALFAPDPSAPDGVVWLHVHETWLPEGTPDEDGNGEGGENANGDANGNRDDRSS